MTGLVSVAIEVAVTVFTLSGWALYWRERGRSRDYATDLLGVVRDEELGREDLRRSLRWSEVADRVDRWSSSESSSEEVSES